jgi:hypothetical protein
MSRAISLLEAFAQVPDPRDAQGRRHPLPAILALTSVAILSGARSLYAIAQFGRDRGKAFAAALGFTRDIPPCCATLHYLFAALDRKAFERAIRRWTKVRAAAGWKSVSLDGKRLRGTQGHEVPGVHLLAAYAHEAKIVLDQVPVDAKTNEHKTALQMLNLIPLEGKLVTGDAMFCQRDLSRKIRKKQGHWLWPVKANQPDLLEALTDAFATDGVSPLGTKGRRRRASDRHFHHQGAWSRGDTHPDPQHRADRLR